MHNNVRNACTQAYPSLCSALNAVAGQVRRITRMNTMGCMRGGFGIEEGILARERIIQEMKNE